MQNDFPNFGKRYKIIRAIAEKNCGKCLEWSRYLIYDPETNKVLSRGYEGESFWIDFPIYLAMKSWPYAITGKWPTAKEYITPIAKEELEYIYENTTDFVEFGEKKNAE